MDNASEDCSYVDDCPSPLGSDAGFEDFLSRRNGPNILQGKSAQDIKSVIPSTKQDKKLFSWR